MNKEPSTSTNTYWRQTRRLTMGLLLTWLLLSFGILFFARELNSLRFFGWSFSFYMAAQGLTLMYVLILAIFSYQSHRISARQKTLAQLAGTHTQSESV
ncbi:DUF4212 domain-containing protein [Undibacterium sp.]|uniref:DUF4212 domain-containing protein n=1 Tax=Undibacterium sp. TaxID=1914977 RepID=UPI0025EB9D13|nr:sodium/substrate symporter small subunit [Undibacterium sp.]